MKPIVFERVSLADAKRVHDGRVRPATPQEFAARRAMVNGTESLLPATLKWIDALPAEERPHELARTYARIANRICALWDKPERCRHYLDDLLIARRVGRKGFPAAVAKEISDVTAHFATLHPAGRPWT